MASSFFLPAWRGISGQVCNAGSLVFLQLGHLFSFSLFPKRLPS